MACLGNGTTINKVSSSLKVGIGSSVEEVVKALGTPDSYLTDSSDRNYLRTMLYGKKYIYFTDCRKVFGIEN
jgi:hypothetical protein